MTTRKLKLSRKELETFLKNYEQVKQFEKLFEVVDQVSESPDTEGLSVVSDSSFANSIQALAQIVELFDQIGIEARNADNKAAQALDCLSRIADSLELIALKPVLSENKESFDNLTPIVQVGTLAYQNAESVNANLTDNTTSLIKSSVALSNGAGAAAGTLTNAPTAGNPTKWVPIDDNGTTRYIPAW